MFPSIGQREFDATCDRKQAPQGVSRLVLRLSGCMFSAGFAQAPASPIVFRSCGKVSSCACGNAN